MSRPNTTKLNPVAQAAFDAFTKVWREAKRHDHETFVLAWESAARAAVNKATAYMPK